ncbi:transposable element Tcb2 transposase [Trichonephila clavipes]|nr:transposable element Tcb2 transposase [Trichonephila clavipes]
MFPRRWVRREGPLPWPPESLDKTAFDFLRKNRWNAGILTIANRGVSNSKCGPVCDLKIVADVSKNGRCYPTTSIRLTKRFTTPLQDLYLIISARRQTGSTVRALGSALTIATGIRISRQTVYRRLNHAGLYARKPAVCIPLTSAHKRARLKWSLKHQHWSVGEWANWMFSDESRFNLSSDSRWVTIWRESGTRFEPKNITERHHFPSRGVMWPANSPDLNPIKHVWDILGRQITALSHPPSSITELKRALQEAWNRLSPQLIHHLIASIVNRCAACLAVRGDHTPY